jgi:hypothetical protein
VLAQPPLHLLNVLAGVRRGRVAYLCLTPTQVRELRDPDGRIALDVLRHLLGARPMTPERFPLTEEALQGVARRLGYVVGQKRCRRMVKRLLASDVIARCGHYRPPALLSESVLSASAPPSRLIFALAGGSTRSLGTFWGCRRRTYRPAPGGA